MRYDIRVRGSIQAEVVAGLGDVTVVESGPDTILQCRVPDVAALAGLLRAMAQAGLVIRELRKVDPGSSAPAVARPGEPDETGGPDVESQGRRGT